MTIHLVAPMVTFVISAQGTDLQYHYAPTVTKIWRPPRRSQCPNAADEAPEIRSNDIDDVTEIVGDRFDRNGIEYMGLSAARRPDASVLVVAAAAAVATAIAMLLNSCGA